MFPSRLLRLLAAVLFASLFHGVALASSSIGLYTDESGSSCAFTGNDPGLVTAYVVIRPDADGVTGVRFAAPLPACFGGVFINDTALPGTFTIGDTQTGISLAIAGCVTTPQAVLAVNYFRNGSTSACCPFPIVADPSVGALEATTCTFANVSLTAVTSHLNVDASCPCDDDVAPLPPYDPLPADNQVSVAEWPTLTWHANDWDGDIVEYDVYLGASPSPSRVACIPAPTYEPAAPLSPLTQYYWRIVARDAGGRETAGPLWKFTTRSHNHPPTVTIVSPADAAINVPIAGTLLNWSASDLDFDGISFDVYFGTGDPPPLVASTATNSYNPQRLEYDTGYYWRVVARDGPHSETSTPVAHFTTRDTPPQGPSDPYPANQQVELPLSLVMNWTSIDPEGEATTNKVYFGTDPYDPPLVASNIVPDVNHVGHYSPPNLNSATRYYWSVAVRDVGGIEVKGPIWSFVTLGNHPPAVPSNPTPRDGETILSLNQRFAWTAPDPDPFQYPLYYVYLGTTNLKLAAIMGGQFGDSYVDLGPLSPSTTYRWKVVADDERFGVTTGPEWTFTTPPSQPGPPSQPSNPRPTDASIATSTQPTLSWLAIDPQGYALTHRVYFGTSSSPPQVGTTTSLSFPVGPLAQNKKYYWRIRTSNGVYSVTGPTWSFTVQENAVPVLFSRFEADAVDGSAQIRWQLESDEAMDGYTLYRREQGSGPALSITTARITDVHGSFVDRTVSAGQTYHYEMLVRTQDGDEFRSQPATVSMPALDLSLGRNHPNPFNPQTTIPYTVPVSATPTRVKLVIYDTSGRIVRVLVDEEQAGGSRSVVWNGDDDTGAVVSSGIYFSVLHAGKERRTQKMVLLK